VERNGTKWSIQPTPKVAAPNETSLNGVQCTSPAACVAVGVLPVKAGPGPVLAERWNGAKWTVQAALTPSSGLPAGFGSVSCLSAKVCTAVGDDSVTAQQWNGSRWTNAPPATAPGGRYSGLYGVSCASAAACLAVGQVNNGDGSTVSPLTERWNGTTWAILNTPTP
jgi:hypothetical protein